MGIDVLVTEESLRKLWKNDGKVDWETRKPCWTGCIVEGEKMYWYRIGLRDGKMF